MNPESNKQPNWFEKFSEFNMSESFVRNLLDEMKHCPEIIPEFYAAWLEVENAKFIMSEDFVAAFEAAKLEKDGADIAKLLDNAAVGEDARVWNERVQSLFLVINKVDSLRPRTAALEPIITYNAMWTTRFAELGVPTDFFNSIPYLEDDLPALYQAWLEVETAKLLVNDDFAAEWISAMLNNDWQAVLKHLTLSHQYNREWANASAMLVTALQKYPTLFMRHPVPQWQPDFFTTSSTTSIQPAPMIRAVNTSNNNNDDDDNDAHDVDGKLPISSSKSCF